MAQNVCSRFVDYFGMGHFYHKVRVPGRGERWGGPGGGIRPLLPRFPQFVEACHPSPWPGRGNGVDGLVPFHVWGN